MRSARNPEAIAAVAAEEAPNLEIKMIISNLYVDNQYLANLMPASAVFLTLIRFCFIDVLRYLVTSHACSPSLLCRSSSTNFEASSSSFLFKVSLDSCISIVSTESSTEGYPSSLNSSCTNSLS